MLSYLTLVVRTKCIKCTARSLAMDEPGKPAAPPNSALLTVLTRLWTGVKKACDLSSMWSPCACGGHLITWGLDTALISDLRHCQVERWSLGGGTWAKLPRQACRGWSWTCPRGRSRPGQAFLPGKGGLLWVYLVVLILLMRSLISRRAALLVWSRDAGRCWGRGLWFACA